MLTILWKIWGSLQRRWFRDFCQASYHMNIMYWRQPRVSQQYFGMHTWVMAELAYQLDSQLNAHAAVNRCSLSARWHVYRLWNLQISHLPQSSTHCPPILPASSVIVTKLTNIGLDWVWTTEARQNKATLQNSQTAVAELLQQACKQVP